MSKSAWIIETTDADFDRDVIEAGPLERCRARLAEAPGDFAAQWKLAQALTDP